jgi:hypothetical protein
MGTDITLHVEKRVNGEWVEVPCPPDADPEGIGLGFSPQWYWRRAPALFAALAGIRNSRLAAEGIDVEPIAQPRGLPGDVSAVVRSANDDDMDYGATWFCLREIIADPRLDEDFVDTLERIAQEAERLSALRIVVWFNN